MGGPGAVGKLQRNLRTLLLAVLAGNRANHAAIRNIAADDPGGLDHVALGLQGLAGLGLGLAAQAIKGLIGRGAVVVLLVVIRQSGLGGYRQLRSHAEEGLRRLQAAVEVAPTRALAHRPGTQRDGGGAIVIDIRRGGNALVES